MIAAAGSALHRIPNLVGQVGRVGARVPVLHARLESRTSIAPRDRFLLVLPYDRTSECGVFLDLVRQVDGVTGHRRDVEGLSLVGNDDVIANAHVAKEHREHGRDGAGLLVGGCARVVVALDHLSQVPVVERGVHQLAGLAPADADLVSVQRVRYPVHSLRSHAEDERAHCFSPSGCSLSKAVDSGR